MRSVVVKARQMSITMSVLAAIKRHNSRKLIKRVKK